MKSFKLTKKFMSAVMMTALAFAMIITTVPSVFADGAYNQTVGSVFNDNYGDSKYTVDKKYTKNVMGSSVESGNQELSTGTLTGQALVNADTGLLNEDQFRKLTNNSQRQLIKDLNDCAESTLEMENDGQLTYTDEDYKNWVEQLQSQDGVGSRLISTLMANTKPDFASANRIYQPFSGTVGTILGLVAVLLMAALAIVMVLDLAYIAIPFVRNLLDGGSSDNGGGNGGIKSKFVSWEAYNAVQQVEAGGGNGGNSGGDNKTAVGIYFKKRIIMLLILGLCLLYLVQGEIFTIVGWFMDLVSGLLPTT